MTSTLEHGRLSTYKNDACRCDACRQASTEYQRRYRLTPKGRAITNKLNAESNRRIRRAARWAYEHGYEDPA